MPKIAGVDVLVRVATETGETLVVGGQNAASIELSAETIDITDKTSEGWASSMSGMKSFSISCEGLYVTDDAALDLLEQKFLDREFVDVDVRFPNGKTYRGTCAITSMPLEMGQDSAVSYSLELAGVGPLEITMEAPIEPTV